MFVAVVNVIVVTVVVLLISIVLFRFCVGLHACIVCSRIFGPSRARNLRPCRWFNGGVHRISTGIDAARHR